MDWLPFRHKTQQGTELFPEKVRAPPVMEITLETSDKWNALGGANINVMVRQVLDANAGEIMQFFNAQQHMHSLGVSPSSYVERELAQLRLRYENNTGAEKLIILVKPISPNPGVRVIQPANIWDIKAPLTGWPVAGYELAAVSPGVATGTKFGPYLPDPQFINSPVGSYFTPTQNDMAPGTSIANHAFQMPLYSSVKWTDHTGMIVDAMSVDDHGGFVEGWANHGVGGTGVCVKPLEGQQYWEVKIISLPDAVPPPITVMLDGGIYDGEYYQDNVLYQDGTKITQSWDQSLKTFFNPTIGVVADNYVDPHWKKNTIAYESVIGLDPDTIPVGRTIGVAPTSTMYGSGKNVTWQGSIYYYESQLHVDDQGKPVRHYLWGLMINVPGNPYLEPPPPDEIAGINFRRTTAHDPITNVLEAVRVYQFGIANKYIVEAIIFADQDLLIKSIPDSAFFDTLIAQATANRQAQNANDVLNGITDPPIIRCGLDVAYNGTGGSPTSIGGVALPYDYITYQSGIPITWTIDAIVGDSQVYILGSSLDAFYGAAYSECPPPVVKCIPGKFNTAQLSNLPFGDGLATNDAYDSNGDLTLQGLTAPGTHAYVYKGRYDAIQSILTSQKDVDIMTTDGGGHLGNGVWTGVDLKELAVNDVVMVATDVKTRGIWFGKNGKWYDKTGPTDRHPGQDGFEPATLMDGDHTVKYYPACSFRLGPIHLRMLFSGSQIYTPPGSFTGYGVLPPVIIQST